MQWVAAVADLGSAIWFACLAQSSPQEPGCDTSGGTTRAFPWIVAAWLPANQRSTLEEDLLCRSCIAVPAGLSTFREHMYHVGL